MKNILKVFSVIIISSILFAFCDESSKSRDKKNCTSSRFECAFNLTKGPRVYFSDLDNARPYSRNCKYSGRLYQLGWSIPIVGDPCANCLCDERWDDNNPLDSLSCSRIDCEIDVQIKLKAGCLPIYSSTECCPIDYYCRQQCVFNGTRYGIGTKLYVKLERDKLCDECRCSAPPHFTCVSKVCTQSFDEKIILLNDSQRR